MSAPRRFSMTDDSKPSKKPPKPLQFTLDGKLTKPIATGDVDEVSGEPLMRDDWSETFTVLDEIPPGALADLSMGASVNDDGEVEWNRLAILKFLRASLVPEDEPRWDALMRDKQRTVKLDVLGAVMFYITGKKADRPTGPRPGSPNGSRDNGAGSGLDSSHEDSPQTS